LGLSPPKVKFLVTSLYSITNTIANTRAGYDCVLNDNTQEQTGSASDTGRSTVV